MNWPFFMAPNVIYLVHNHVQQVYTARQHIVVCFDVKRIQIIIFLFHFRKLHEVRDRLDQLKDLAQYYQGGSEFDCATDGATYVMEQLARRADGDKRENRRWVCVGGAVD